MKDITKADIQVLLSEALQSGDLEQVEICKAALGQPSTFKVTCFCTQEAALDVCITVIKETRERKASLAEAIKTARREWNLR